jgi:hypothetical protein
MYYKRTAVQVCRGGRGPGRMDHPRSKESSSGLKQALDSSRNHRRALPPFLVPKRVDRGLMV